MQKATLAILNANIYTMNKKQPKAQAIAIHRDKIIAIGNNNQIKPYVNKQTKILNLKGKTVIPGLTDTHIHLTAYAKTLTQLNLTNVKSIKQIQNLLKKQTQKQPPNTWIIARGWEQEKLKEKRLPTKWDIDKQTPNHPAILTRICGHICLVNTKALKIAGITKNTPNPKGGQIDKHPKTKEPTGILREKAINLVQKHIPKPNQKQLTKLCQKALKNAAKHGITAIHWIINTPEEIQIIKMLEKQNKLPIRVYIITPVKYLNMLVKMGLHTGKGNEKVKVGSVKVFADGSLGAHTAALREPYVDKPSVRGILRYTQKELNELVLRAHRAGFQLAMHAIGDYGVDLVLNAVEYALRECPRENHRHRVEHASVLDLGLIRRMCKLGVVACVQPHFVVSDFWVVERLGVRRARWVYPFKSLLKEGVMVAGGSDCPVEPISPFLGIYGAVKERSYSKENVSVWEALELYTVNAAFVSFDEDVRGSLEVGKLADFVVLSEDLFDVSVEKVGKVEVLLTVVGGEVVYRKGVSV